MNRIDMVNEGVRLMLRNRDTASAVEAILDMAEPLIREQIAAEIEAQPIDHRSPGRANVSGLVTFARREAYLRAAAIARGGDQ